jgi:hypothetical protein
MEAKANMAFNDLSMSKEKLTPNNSDAELLIIPGWNRMREQEKHKRRVLGAMANLDNDEDEELMLINLSKAILQHPRESQLVQRMSEAGVLKRSSSRTSHGSLAGLGSIKESQPLSAPPSRRRRFQRRNSFVIHRNKQGGSKPSLLGNEPLLYNSTPNLIIRQKPDSQKYVSPPSQHASWNKESTSSQNATWSNNPDSRKLVSPPPPQHAYWNKESTSSRNATWSNNPDSRKHVSPSSQIASWSKESTSSQNATWSNNPDSQKHVSPSSQHASWSKESTSSQNATWSNNNASWANTDESKWYDLKPMSINSKPTISQSIQQRMGGGRVADEITESAPDAVSCSTEASSLSSLHGSYNCVLHPIDMEESPRTPRLLLSKGVQHHINASRSNVGQ